MSVRPYVSTIAFAAMLSSIGCGERDDPPLANEETTPASAATSSDEPTSAMDAAPLERADLADARPEPAYPASEDGLRALLDDLLAAAARGDRTGAYELADGLRLPDARAYFTEVFGEELGAELAGDYTELADRLRELVPLLWELTSADDAELRVEAYDRAGDGAVGYQARAFERMRSPTPLYSVRVPRGGDPGFHLWSFVHDGDAFRWVGKMRAVAPDGAPLSEQLEMPEGAEIPQDAADIDLFELPEDLDVIATE